MVFLKVFFEKVFLEKVQQTTKKHERVNCYVRNKSVNLSKHNHSSWQILWYFNFCEKSTICIHNKSSLQCILIYAGDILPYCILLGCVVQLVTCLIADPGVTSSILARSHTFTEIDHGIISMAFSFPSTDSRRVVVSYKHKYVHKVQVNHLVKLA